MTDRKFTNFEFICEFSAYEISEIMTDFIPVEDMNDITSGSLWKSRGPLCTTVHWLRIWTKPNGMDGRAKDPNTGVKVRIPEEFFNTILEKHKAYMNQI